MWIMCCYIQNSYPLFYSRISQDKIMPVIISHPALELLGSGVFINILHLQLREKNCKEKNNHLPYPHFLITTNIPDSFGIAAWQTFVLRSQICISDRGFPQIYKASLFPDQILSSNIEIKLPLWRYKAILQETMGIETRSPGSQPQAALIPSCIGVVESQIFLGKLRRREGVGGPATVYKFQITCSPAPDQRLSTRDGNLNGAE